MLSNDLKMQQCIFLNMLLKIFHFHLENKGRYNKYIALQPYRFYAVAMGSKWAFLQIVGNGFPAVEWASLKLACKHPFDEIPDLIRCLPMCTPSHSEDKRPLISQFPLSHHKLEHTVGLQAKQATLWDVRLKQTFKFSWQPNFGHLGEL